jgi:hypothetical protein
LFNAPLTREGSGERQQHSGSSTSLLGTPPPSPGFGPRNNAPHSLGGWRRGSQAGLQNIPDMLESNQPQSTSKLFSAPRRSRTSENLMSPSMRNEREREQATPGGMGMAGMHRRSTSAMLDPSIVPSDMPVSRTGRRSSSGINLLARTPDRHANSTSMAGFYAEQQQSRTPLVSVNQRSMSGLSSALGAKTPRLSLSDKIKAIRLSAGGLGAAPTTGGTASEDAPKAPVQRRASQLLSPDFFASPSAPHTPPADRKVVARRGSAIRVPTGPDGTKGFMARRRSSIDAGMLTNAVAVLG